jgi:hypothetical protein
LAKTDKRKEKKREENNENLCNVTYTLLDRLCILNCHTRPPDAPQMPRRFQRQVLDHNGRQNDQFRLNGAKNAVVAEIEPIGELLGQKFEVLVVGENGGGVLLVSGVDYVEPVLAALDVCLAGFPVFSAVENVLVKSGEFFSDIRNLGIRQACFPLHLET